MERDIIEEEEDIVEGSIAVTCIQGIILLIVSLVPCLRRLIRRQGRSIEDHQNRVFGSTQQDLDRGELKESSDLSKRHRSKEDLDTTLGKRKLPETPPSTPIKDLDKTS